MDFNIISEVELKRTSTSWFISPLVNCEGWSSHKLSDATLCFSPPFKFPSGPQLIYTNLSLRFHQPSDSHRTHQLGVFIFKIHHKRHASQYWSFLDSLFPGTWNPVHRYAQLRDRVSPAFVLVILASKVSTAITVHCFM
jgi:hypothetical protein